MTEPTGSTERKPPILPPAPEPAPVEPYETRELSSALTRPLRVLDIALSDPGRLASTIAGGTRAVHLAVLLLVTSVLFALPYGAVLDPPRLWRVALLFLGSLGICFPSLQVFSAYIGCRIDTRQNLALGLVITSVAALFTFGFFPILWFLEATMLDDAGQVTAQDISVVLLAVSLLAGVAHLFRCLQRFEGLLPAYSWLLLAWQILFLFITFRMADLLELLP